MKGRLEGIGRFSHEVLRRVATQHPEHEFIFLFDRKPDSMFLYADNVRPVVLSPQARHPVLYILWFEFMVKKALKKHRADVFFSPDGFLSLKSEVPSIPVIHDLNFEHHPEVLDTAHRKYYHKFFPLFAEKARHILTVSEYSARDIQNTYGVDSEKISVAYNGVGSSFKPSTLEEQSRIKQQYSSGQDYFLFVGSLQPRKNLPRLFEAFDLFKEGGNSGDVKLVIAGAKYNWNQASRQAYEMMHHKEDVIFTDRVNDEDLSALLGSALSLVFVPLFEGFGLPIIEAFACGTPVITSNTTSMPEVAGDAAIVVDPFNVEEITEAMGRISEDENLRKEMSAAGIERSKSFDWQSTADAVWKVIQSELPKN